MSKIKSPTEKKALSYDRDRRNSYGESPHSSRKNIRRGKQRTHQEARRVATQVLARAINDNSDDSACEIENDVLTATKVVELNGFKKKPDIPLRVIIARKLRGRYKQTI
jgi:hypothetical protein